MDSSVEGRKRDAVGIGMSKSLLMYINLKEAKVQGVVCSDNWGSPFNLMGTDKY